MWKVKRNNNNNKRVKVNDEQKKVAIHVMKLVLNIIKKQHI